MDETDNLRTAIAKAVKETGFVYGREYAECAADNVLDLLADPALLSAVLEAIGHEVREGWEVDGEVLIGGERTTVAQDLVLVVRPRGETT